MCERRGSGCIIYSFTTGINNAQSPTHTTIYIYIFHSGIAKGEKKERNRKGYIFHRHLRLLENIIYLIKYTFTL